MCRCWNRWFSVQKSDISCYFFEKIFFWSAGSALLFKHYGSKAGKKRCKARHIFLLKFQYFRDVRVLEPLIFRSKKWRGMLLFWKNILWSAGSALLFRHYGNKAGKCRIRPWHIFERVFNGFRTSLIWNPWNISNKSRQFLARYWIIFERHLRRYLRYQMNALSLRLLWLSYLMIEVMSAITLAHAKAVSGSGAVENRSSWIQMNIKCPSTSSK